MPYCTRMLLLVSALAGAFAAQVVLGGVERRAGENGLRRSPIDRRASQPQEGLLREILGHFTAEPAGDEGHQPAAVGAVSRLEFFGPSRRPRG
jgi:hypothetical protein